MDMTLQGSDGRRRYTEIEICRGIGIILVVLGHALKQTGEGGTAFDMLLSVIYSFHMPLFFVLSGFVSLKVLDLSDAGSRAAYMKNRAFRLLIPYFTVGVLYIPLKLYMSRYAIKPYHVTDIWKLLIGENPNTALWYLYILFWLSTAAAWILTRRTLTVWLGITFVISALAWHMDMTWKMPKYAFFFVLGLFIRVHYQAVKKLMAMRWVTAAFGIMFAAANVLLYEKGWTGMQIATAVSGSALVFTAAYALEKHGCDRMLQMAGSYSMDIYIFSEPVGTVCKLILWNMLHMHYLLCTLVCLTGGLLLPIPISKYIVRKVKIFRTAFLGMH